jgi:predicted glycosyltransferase
MKRVLIYSHDTFGLGNIRRMLEVARHLVASSPEVSVLVLTGSPMLHAFRIPAGIDYIKLPCLSRGVDGRYGARSLPLSLDTTVRLRANLVRSAIADFEPDLILVDKKPFGVEDELAGALSQLPAGAARPKLVLLLRDILDHAETTSRIWRKNGYFEAISAYYDQVLVVGCPTVYDLRTEYGFPPFAAAKVAFCGYISREPSRRSRQQVRQDMGLGAAQPLVLVTPGGGEDGHALISHTLQALASLPPGAVPRTHIVCGPELAEAQRAQVHQRAAALPGVTVQDFCDDMMGLMAAADVVLAMGGYNTVCELLTLRRRAVLVPRIKPGVEQCIRAERMAAMGLVRMVHPDALTPHALLAALQTELAAVQARLPAATLRRMDGLAGVTQALFALMDHQPPAARALAPAAAGRAATTTSVTTATPPLPPAPPRPRSLAQGAPA